MNLPQNVLYVINKLQSCGFEAFCVGGCVRDFLMGIAPGDYDITTNAQPCEILSCFSNDKTLTNGIKHGTVTIVVDGECIEVTTYRIDGDYKDSRHPESVSFSRRLSDDLSRRDFTVNTICFSNSHGFVDLFGGRNDIKAKIIRCVGDPDKRFCEDALRIMRAIRFSSVLGFDIEYATSESLISNAHLLKNISAERKFTELSKLLCGKNAYKTILKYSDVIKQVVPEMAELTTDDFAAISEMFLNCTQNSDSLVLFYCCLFSRMSDSKAAQSSLKNLKAPNVLIKAVGDILSENLNDFCDDTVYAKKLAARVGYKNAKLFCLFVGAKFIEKSQCTTLLLKKLDVLEKNNACISISQLDISGNDLTELSATGRQIGDILKLLCQEVMEEKIINSKKKLIYRAQQLFNEGSTNL